MADHSKIEWTEATWNPVVGCSVLSPGCTNCYAMKDAWRKNTNPRLPRYHGLTMMTKGGPEGYPWSELHDDEARPIAEWGLDGTSAKGGDPAEWPEDLRVREYPR